MKNIVKLMKEQGNQFDWSSIVIDLSELPCFKPEAEWPSLSDISGPTDLLADGYTVVSAGVRPTNNFIVRVTGENPSVSIVDGSPVFVDCEPVTAGELIEPLSAVPAIIIAESQEGVSYAPAFNLEYMGGGAMIYPFSASGPNFFVGYQNWES